MIVALFLLLLLCSSAVQSTFVTVGRRPQPAWATFGSTSERQSVVASPDAAPWRLCATIDDFASKSELAQFVAVSQSLGLLFWVGRDGLSLSRATLPTCDPASQNAPQLPTTALQLDLDTSRNEYIYSVSIDEKRNRLLVGTWRGLNVYALNGGTRTFNISLGPEGGIARVQIDAVRDVAWAAVPANSGPTLWRIDLSNATLPATLFATLTSPVFLHQLDSFTLTTAGTAVWTWLSNLRQAVRFPLAGTPAGVVKTTAQYVAASSILATSAQAAIEAISFAHEEPSGAGVLSVLTVVGEFSGPKQRSTFAVQYAAAVPGKNISMRGVRETTDSSAPVAVSGTSACPRFCSFVGKCNEQTRTCLCPPTTAVVNDDCSIKCDTGFCGSGICANSAFDQTCDCDVGFRKVPRDLSKLKDRLFAGAFDCERVPPPNRPVTLGGELSSSDRAVSLSFAYNSVAERVTVRNGTQIIFDSLFDFALGRHYLRTRSGACKQRALLVAQPPRALLSDVFMLTAATEVVMAKSCAVWSNGAGATACIALARDLVSGAPSDGAAVWASLKLPSLPRVEARSFETLAQTAQLLASDLGPDCTASAPQATADPGEILLPPYFPVPPKTTSGFSFAVTTVEPATPVPNSAVSTAGTSGTSGTFGTAVTSGTFGEGVTVTTLSALTTEGPVGSDASQMCNSAIGIAMAFLSFHTQSQ
jgi:hypothetical protein